MTLPPQTTSTPSNFNTLSLVLDTNVVLDWLLFAQLPSLTTALQQQTAKVCTHALTLAEFKRVLGYPAFKLDATRQTNLYAQYCHYGCDSALPAGFAADALLLPEAFPVCKDPDDQVFLALAFHLRADALVTRDRALLALRKRARKYGVIIIEIGQLELLLTSSPGT